MIFQSEKSSRLGIFLLAATLFSAISVAITAYPLGFGFDPFIHRATVEHIVEYGTITPKPFYYIGQYALELIAVHAFSLPLSLVDRLLVPLIGVAFVVISGAIALRRHKKIGLLGLFLLPLSIFIVTTPQSLAYIFTICLLLLSLPRLFKEEDAPTLPVLFILTLAALATHPLAGIPAFIYFILVCLVTWNQVPQILKTSSLIVFSVFAAVAMPLIFVFQAKKSGLEITFTLAHLFDGDRLGFTSFLGNHYSSVFDGLYLVIDNLFWILMIFGVIGFIFVKRRQAPLAVQLPLLAALLWIINYWLLSTTLEFRFLIEYERQNYALRLLTLSAIFLIPHTAFAIDGIFDRLKNRPTILQHSFAVFLAVLAAANVYGAYPRHDNYARSAGFNVGSTDFDTVYAINQDARDNEYIVLANQAVSAAALETFGFKKYYHGDIFYYPIPTGGELYEYYLLMADDAPTRERALAAMDVAGVDTAYFVVNEYWWRSDVIIERAKSESDEWFSVGDGAVTVFVYRR